MSELTIRVQEEDFDVGEELARLSESKPQVGAVACFVGLVRDMEGGGAIDSMTLEHYPGMTEEKLRQTVTEAEERWPLEDCLVIHRTGRLEPGDRIVLAAATSAHRDAAFEACRFIIDWLKTSAPFWKQEQGSEGTRWVKQRDNDRAAARRWEKD
jgi:molybdopterin synthase catalytic subunit